MSRIKRSRPIDVTPVHDAFPYQRDAYIALRDLEYAAIFHEQGLGKTKIAVDIFLYWLENRIVDTVVIVVKKGLIENWKREIASHSRIIPRILSQSRQLNYDVFNSPTPLIIAHYEILLSEEKRIRMFCGTRNVGVILDESAKIKNPSAALTQSALALRLCFQRRVIMTGTPVANRPEDIWSQIAFLDGGSALGQDFRCFKRSVTLDERLEWDEQRQVHFERALERILARISSFTVRETKASGIIHLPAKLIERIDTDWETYQYELYAQYREEMRAIVIRDGIPTEDNAGELLKRLLRLVQIASNPSLVNESYNRDPGKISYLLNLVQRIIRQGEKCIVWSSFTANVDWLARELKYYGTQRLHGKLAMDQRNRAIEKFLTDPKICVLIATPGAAKEGLTLTVANHVVFYDRSFSLDDYLQAQDRIHRISQSKVCHVYNLIMGESIDEWVDALLVMKHLAASLAQGDISLDDYRRQVTYDFSEVLRRILGINRVNN